MSRMRFPSSFEAIIYTAYFVGVTLKYATLDTATITWCTDTKPKASYKTRYAETFKTIRNDPATHGVAHGPVCTYPDADFHPTGAKTRCSCHARVTKPLHQRHHPAPCWVVIYTRSEVQGSLACRKTSYGGVSRRPRKISKYYGLGKTCSPSIVPTIAIGSPSETLQIPHVYSTHFDGYTNIHPCRSFHDVHH